MSDLITLVPMLALLLAVGALAGLMAGLLGVGGGIVLVPAYFYTFAALGFAGDQLMQVCIATSLATIVVTSIRSVLAHHRRGAVNWDVLKSWAPGIVAGAALGVWVVAGLGTTVLQGIFGLVGITIGLFMAFGRPDWRLGDVLPGGIRRGALSAAIGFLSTLMGIGGGSFAVPLMTLFGHPIHRAVATAAGFGLAIAAPAALGFLLVDIPPASRPPFTIGAINMLAFVITISMTLITAPLGARLAHGMDAKPLRRVFAAFLILVAANMLRVSLGF